MKKSKLLLVLASAFILSGCNLFNKGGNSEAPASSGSESSGSESSGSESSQAQGQSFSFADVVASFAAAGVEGVSIPNYNAASESATCTYDTANGEFLLTGTTNAEMQVYAQALTAAGWTLTTDEYGDYSGVFGETRAQLWLEDWLDYSKAAIVLGFTLAPENVFPSEDIAAYLTANSWTDTMPVFSNALTTGFQFSADYGQLIILTASGSEDALLEAVVSFYLSEQGGFANGGVDANGYHLVSANAQFELVAWDWPAQYPGYVILNFQAYVAPAAEFPVADVNAFLSSYSLGFSLSASAEYSGTAFSTDSGASGNYHYFMVTATGGDYSAYCTLLGELVTANGYSLDSTVTTKTVYYNADEHEVQIIPGEGYVTIMFWE